MKYLVSLSALLALAAAIPLNEKRDVTTQDVVVTETTTTTIWIDPADPTPANFAEQAAASSSSVAPPPSPSPDPTTTAADPPPTTAADPPPVATTAAAAAPAPASGGGIVSDSGQLTYYNVEAGTGSCGLPIASSSQYVVAVNVADMTENYSGNPNDNPLCGKSITITCNGVTGTGTVYDTCPDCPKGNLDLSSGFFDLFGSEATGRLDGATWTIS
jgi:hypothetical protein